MGIYTEIASAVLKLVFALLSVALGSLVIPWIRSTAIPWLKEKRLYNVVQKFVQAAEKLGETGAIDRAAKKDYVISLLTKKGYVVDAEVEAFIESAVKEMDMLIESGVTEIINEFEIPSEEGDVNV